MLNVSSRQAKLVNIMHEKREYLPAKYYADYLKVSERTIFNDLTKLENIFNFKFKRKPNQGIKIPEDITSSDNIIQHIKKSKIEALTNYSPLERQILIAKRLLIENQIVTYHALSLDLYISTTSIIKDINQIRGFLDDDIRLISNVKGTRVQGTEIGIQKAIKRFAYYLIEQEMHNHSLSSYAKILEPLFTKKVMDSVYASIDELISVLDVNVSEQYVKSLFISLLILTERAYRGFHLNDLPGIHLKGAEYLTNYPLTVQICHRISSQIEITYTELEHRYISNQLFAHRIETKLNNKYIENLFSGDIQLMIADVSKALDVNLKNDDKLYNSLIYHMFPMIFRLKSDIDVFNPLLDEIKHNYGVLFRIIWYVVETFEKKYDIKLSEDDVAFITIHFRVALERKEEITHILVVCQTGLVTSDLIINRIKKLLPANIDLKLVAKPHLKNEDLSKVDFIISSVQLKNITRPIVYVSPLVTDKDLMEIYSYYLKHSSTVRKRETEELNSDLISMYLSDRYIFLNENMATKEECLDKMIHQLQRDGIAKKHFRDSVYERERLGNTLVQDWVAVPHALSSEVNETKIAFMTTEKPVKWNDDACVSLIILLAVAEGDMANIRKLLGHLFEVILMTEGLGKGNFITSLKKPEEIISLFQDKSKSPSS